MADEAARVTEEDLRRWERLATEATPGPWSWWMSESPPFKLGNATDPRIGITAGTIMDAQFLCAAREAVPALVGEVRRLREALCHYRDQCPACEGRGEVVWPGEETARAPGPCPRCRVAREALGEGKGGG